jgi:hypothetical protein
MNSFLYYMIFVLLRFINSCDISFESGEIIIKNYYFKLRGAKCGFQSPVLTRLRNQYSDRLYAGQSGLDSQQKLRDFSLPQCPGWLLSPPSLLFNR